MPNYDTIRAAYGDAVRRYTQGRDALERFLGDFLGLVQTQLGGDPRNVWYDHHGAEDVWSPLDPEQVLSFDGRIWRFTLRIGILAMQGKQQIDVNFQATYGDSGLAVGIVGDSLRPMPGNEGELIKNFTGRIVDRLKMLTLKPDEPRTITIGGQSG